MNGKFTVKYGYREHRGSLCESLKTMVYISKEVFSKSLNLYDFYCFDDRCNQVLFIAKNMQKQKFTWLFIEVISSEN